MTAGSIAKLLGGDLVGSARILAPGPGHSPADRSMSVLMDPDAPDGFVVSSFAGDDWRLCRDHVRHVLGLAREFEYRDKSRSWRPEQVPEPDAHPASSHHTKYAAQLWQQATPIDGTLVATYLTHRGLGLPAEILDGHAIRFHDACPFRLEHGGLVKLPTMLAAMVDICTNAFRGVHRTALAADGHGKAVLSGLGNPKKMLGASTGACVKLCADDDVTLGLHVAEGIETTLACMDMGFRPIWVTLSAGGMARLPVVAGVEALTIFADRDEAGRQAARACSGEWVAAGREVTTILPEHEGTDFAERSRP